MWKTVNQERGQVLMLVAVLLTGLLGLVGLVVDTGHYYAERRQVQNAADQATMAAALEFKYSGNVSAATTAAMQNAAANGFNNDGSSNTVTVNRPPSSGPHAGDNNYIEVLIDEQPQTFFIHVLTSGGHVKARGVAGITNPNILPYNFVSLRSDCKKHTLLVNAGGVLTVNGGMYVNSCSWDNNDPGSQCKHGDAFDVFGSGQIHAQSINVVGGWETHGPCDAAYLSPAPLVNQPIIPDPLAGLAYPDPSAQVTRYGSPSTQSKLIISGGTTTIQPGTYWGGIQIKSSANVTMAPGLYVMAGGGFEASGGATLTGNGVTIFNTSSSGTANFKKVKLTASNVVLSPMTSGPYSNLLIFNNRNNSNGVDLSPGNGINGLSGTVYSAKFDSVVKISASGTANIQIIAGMIEIDGANATIQYVPTGLFGVGIQLVE